MIFFTSDNLIEKVNQFNKSVSIHKKYLTDKNIFIFGIKPKSPSSEYGYFLTKNISKKINKVYMFIEKPNKLKAKEIVKKKGYMNSGMFFMRKDSIINNFTKCQLNLFKKCKDSVSKSTTSKYVYYLNKKSFRKLKDISFDYAILENSTNISGIKLNISLIDLGNWKEIWKFFKKNKPINFIKKNTFYRPWGKYINLHSGKENLFQNVN